MNKLVYLSYGGGHHALETEFSILTALRFQTTRESSGKIIVYTDRPDRYRKLPVSVETLSESQLRAWVGPGEYIHRSKVAVIQHALQKHRCPIMFVDSDTWFKRSPRSVFDRIKPGQSCLHLRETALLDADNVSKHGLSEFLQRGRITDCAGNILAFPPNATCWNSGVVAMHSDDAPLLNEVMWLIDQIWAGFKDAHDVEQFAMGYVLERRTKLQEAHDVVFHYWPSYMRQPFRAALPDLLADLQNKPLGERARAAYKRRPRIPVKRLPKHLLKENLIRAGFKMGSPRTSG